MQQGVRHVRAAGANPNIADHHVIDRQSATSCDNKRVRSACLQRADPNFPISVGVGDDLFLQILQGDGNFFSRVSGAENGHFHAALQDCAGREQAIELHVGSDRRDGKAKLDDERAYYGDQAANSLMLRNSMLRLTPRQLPRVVPAIASQRDGRRIGIVNECGPVAIRKLPTVAASCLARPPDGNHNSALLKVCKYSQTYLILASISPLRRLSMLRTPLRSTPLWTLMLAALLLLIADDVFACSRRQARRG